MVCIRSQRSRTVVISATVAARGTIMRTVLTITARHRIVQLENKAHLSARIHVQILPFGLNQAEVVKFVEENFMVRHVLQIISYNMRGIGAKLG